MAYAVIETEVAVDTAIYASGDLIGPKLTLPVPAKHGKIVSVVLIDQAAQSAAIDVLFWGANPGATTFTDNGALDVADADLDNAIGIVPVAVADYDNLADNRIATVSGYGLVYYIGEQQQNSGLNLYACLVSRGTPTYAASTDVKIKVGIEY